MDTISNQSAGSNKDKQIPIKQFEHGAADNLDEKFSHSLSCKYRSANLSLQANGPTREPLTVVTITVCGADGKDVVFSGFKELICELSPMFNATFNGNFREGETQSMKLPGIDQEVFGVLNHWLHTREVYDNEDWNKTDPVSLAPTLILLAKVWLLARYALIPDLQPL